MTNSRDNEEERMARVEHVLARLTEDRVDADRIQQRRHRVIAELYSGTERRDKFVGSMRKILRRKSRRKKKDAPQRPG